MNNVPISHLKPIILGFTVFSLCAFLSAGMNDELSIHLLISGYAFGAIALLFSIALLVKYCCSFSCKKTDSEDLPTPTTVEPLDKAQPTSNINAEINIQL